MCAVGSRSEGNIYTAVDKDFRTMWIRQFVGCLNQFEQRSGAQIFFANLNPFNACRKIAGDRV